MARAEETPARGDPDPLPAPPDRNIVFGINDDSARGGLQAFEAAGMDTANLLVVGFGCEGKACKNALLEGSPYKVSAAMFPEFQGRLLIDAATFFVSLSAVAWARWPTPTPSTNDSREPVAALLVGARLLRSHRLGRTVLSAQLAQAGAAGCVFAGIAPHLQRDLGGDATTYGLQGAVYGAALLFGSWIIGQRAVRRIGVLYALGFIVNGLGNSGFALASSLTMLLPATFVASLGAAAFITGEITLLQVNLPPAVRGRVIALTIPVSYTHLTLPTSDLV